jgi:hypothetical protein
MPYGKNRWTLTGPLVTLLPYIEQDNLYRQIDPRVHTVVPAGAANPVDPASTAATPGLVALWPTTFSAARNRVKTFECPSDPSLYQATDAIAFDVGQGNQTGPAPAPRGAGSINGYTVPSLVASGGLPGLTNYMPSAGTLGKYTPNGTSTTHPYYAAHEGVFVAEDKTTIPGLADGSSNTMLFFEVTGGFSTPTGGSRTWSYSWLHGSGMPTYWSATANKDLFTISSFHSGIANVAFGDGSIRTIRTGNAIPASAAEIVNRTNAPWDALQRFAGKADGDTNVNGVID